MLSKLRRRFLLDTLIMSLVVLIGSTALLIVASYTYSQNYANGMMSALLDGVTRKTVTYHAGSKGRAPSAEVDWTGLELRDEVSLLILSEEGDVLAQVTPSRSLKKELQKDLPDVAEFVLNEKGDFGLVSGHPLRYMKQPLKGIGYKVAIMDRSSELNALYFQMRIFVVLAFIILILMLILSDFLARRSITPVDEAIRTQQQFIADASHELKTPLTVILANLDIIGLHPENTVGESAKWLESTKSETRRMSKLVNEMLFLARSDAAMDMNYNFRLINFGDAVDEVVLATEALAFERNITLESDIAADSMVIGDFERLKQVAMILVENATKYVDEGGTISVKLTSNPRRTEVLTVTNTGTPIPAEKSIHIFDRFYRADESRVRDQGGYGLGLSIAQKIVEKHNGKIALDFSNEKGTCFSVRIPNAQSFRAPDLSSHPEQEALQ